MKFRILFLTVVLTIGGAIAALAQDIPADYQEVIKYLGKSGDFKSGVLKISLPRNDLHVSVAGVQTPTPFGFGGWIAMTKGEGGNDVAMGDLVLLQEEVNPVMSALLEQGLEVTALHNHFFWEQPRIFYMHVHGFGKATELARKFKPALDLIGRVDPPASPASTDKPILLPNGLDTAKIASIVGHSGEQFGTVYKITVGREDLTLKEMGAIIGTRMGLNTWAAFLGSKDSAVVAGDVAMLAGEVTPVLKALRSNGLEVVAIHHHMTGTDPMIIFLHYWGRGPADKLAAGFRAALDQLGNSHSEAMHH